MSHPNAGAASEVRSALRALRQALDEVPPDALGATAARELTALCCDIERIGVAGKARYARRVEYLDGQQTTGQTSAAAWLAELSGGPVGTAAGLLRAAREIEQLPAVSEAFAAGRVSLDQAREVAQAGRDDPTSTSSLLASVDHESFGALQVRARRIRRAALSELDAERRDQLVHRRRHLRTWSPEEGGLRIDAWLDSSGGAIVLAALDDASRRLLAEHRRVGLRESGPARRADALVRLAQQALGAGTPRSGSSGEAVRARVVIRVDAAALRRGSLHAEEVCEVAGVGPVSVRTAQDLMGDALFNILVHDGVDVRTVTSTKRTIPTALRVALTERDPVCVVPGCMRAYGLEIDHWRRDFSLGGPTELGNLCRVCAAHHAMHTHGGWRLAGGPGPWTWNPPRSIRPAAVARATLPRSADRRPAAVRV